MVFLFKFSFFIYVQTGKVGMASVNFRFAVEPCPKMVSLVSKTHFVFA